MVAVAKKIVRELDAEATVTVAELERLAAAEVSDIESSVVRQNADDLLAGDGANGFYEPQM